MVANSYRNNQNSNSYLDYNKVVNMLEEINQELNRTCSENDVLNDL
jgi:hypothetical protein